MKYIALTFLLCFISALSLAQSNKSWEQYIYELSSIEDESSYTNEETLELLADLAEHPINLNIATREDLERFPFLSAQQIEDILAYIYQYHGMETLGELTMIESLDDIRRKLLSFFVYVKQIEKKNFPSIKNILKYGKHDVMFTYKIPFYERKGDKNGYLGYKYQHSFRYTFHLSDYIKAGLIGAQDAGEPFLANKNSAGYDHYSFYVLIKKLGVLKTLSIGRYKISIGQGLIINSSFSLGKLTMMQTLGRQSTIISAHSSRSAYNYLQGAAATVAISKHIDLTGFISYRNIDATLNKKGGGIQTILKTGYHRTKNEMMKKNNATQLATGMTTRWNSGGFHIGASVLFTCFDKPLQQNKNESYKKYAPQDNNFWNIGVDYGYLTPHWNLQGETATNNIGAIATMNMLSWKAAYNLTIIGVQRLYGHKYYSLFSKGFSEGGHVQNESGILLGVNYNPIRGLSLQAYTDIIQFPYPKYRVHIGSKAWDNFISAIYTYKNIILSARYRYKITEKDGVNKKGLIKDITQRGRLALSYINNKWNCKTQADIVINNYKKYSLGYMISENISYTPLQKLSITTTLGYFNTDSYASRIYIYERAPLYTFSFPSFYGQGIRSSCFARLSTGKHFVGIVRISNTKYFNRDHIGNSYQKINSSVITDIDLQIRWKF